MIKGTATSRDAGEYSLANVMMTILLPREKKKMNLTDS